MFSNVKGINSSPLVVRGAVLVPGRVVGGGVVVGAGVGVVGSEGVPGAVGGAGPSCATSAEIIAIPPRIRTAEMAILILLLSYFLSNV